MADVWVPIGFDPALLSAENRTREFGVGFIGRLKPGISLTEAQQDVASIANAFMHQYGYSGTMLVAPKAYPFARHSTEKARPLIWLLTLAVGCVFLIACANVANCCLPGPASVITKWLCVVRLVQIVSGFCGSVWWRVQCLRWLEQRLGLDLRRPVCLAFSILVRRMFPGTGSGAASYRSCFHFGSVASIGHRFWFCSGVAAFENRSGGCFAGVTTGGTRARHAEVATCGSGF
jgi:hypothetical protein